MTFFADDAYGPIRRSNIQRHIPDQNDEGVCVPACAHGGTCVNKTCVCPSGWAGIDCTQGGLEKCVFQSKFVILIFFITVKGVQVI